MSCVPRVHVKSVGQIRAATAWLCRALLGSLAARVLRPKFVYDKTDRVPIPAASGLQFHEGTHDDEDQTPSVVAGLVCS